MKRILIVATILTMTVVAAQAQSKGKAGPANQAVATQVTSEQFQKFLDATTQLRSDLAGKTAEYQAMLAQTNPDPKQAGELAKQIFELRGKISAEAAKQGLNRGYGGGYGPGNCPNYGGGAGRGGFGCGGGGCAY